MKKPRRKGLDLMTKRAMSGWLFVLPFLVGFVFFVISPLYTSFMFSINQQGKVETTVLAGGLEKLETGNKCNVYLVDEKYQPILDENGNKIYKLERDEKGKLIYIEELLFETDPETGEEVPVYGDEVDEEGNPIQLTEKRAKKLQVQAVYNIAKYDSNGKPIYSGETDSDGNQMLQFDMQLDEAGNQVYEEVTDPVTEEPLINPATNEPYKVPVRTTISNTKDINTITYVGFALYKEALTSKVDYLSALGGAAGQLIYIPAIMVFSFLIANVLNTKFTGRIIARAVFFMPVVTATGIAASLKNGSWEAARFNSTVTGALNGSELDMVSMLKETLSKVEFLNPFVDFISTAFGELGNIVLFSGVQILIFLAALQTISPSLFEASDVEGASKWEAFWKITFPMVSPMILVSLMYTMIDVLTGQNNKVIDYLFRQGIGSGSVSLSDRMAMGWMYFAVAAVLIVIVSAIVSRFVYYENDTK